MIGFYCSTAFHIFMSVLLKHKYFENKRVVLYIVSPLNIKEYNLQALYDLGFENVLFVSNEETIIKEQYAFEQVFFYTLFCHNVNYLKGLQKRKLALVYEGITTFQLKNWGASDRLKRIDIENDIDEIWLPNTKLFVDKEYLYKCKEFDIAILDGNKEKLLRLCNDMNRVFMYTPCEINGKVVFMDRYLTTYLNVCSGAEHERMLVQNIYYGSGETLVIKKHPYDTCYEVKYKNLEDVTVLEENVPWELIYLNNIIRHQEFKVSKYIIYNSFAPANLALLFKDNNFSCICIEPILDKYSCIQNTFLDSDITNQIFSMLATEYNLKVQFIKTLDEYWGLYGENVLCIKSHLWEQVETRINSINISDLRAFRLRMDCALLSVKKKKGFYWINADNLCAEITRQILVNALPEYSETEMMAESDIIIDCDGTLIDHAKDDFDVRDFRIIEGCGRLKKWESDLEKILREKDNIYIWGATQTNLKTFEFLEKVQLKNRLQKVFDSYATGTCCGYSIVPFAKEELEKNSYIMVCANVAYPEIARNLIRLGYQEYIDFGPGVGVRQPEEGDYNV